MLVQTYGQESAKVATAVKLLQKFLAKVDVKQECQNYIDKHVINFFQGIVIQ